MTPLAQKHEQIFSYGDYQKWAKGRWELIDGEVFDMTPAPSRQHQKISLDLAVTLHQFLKDSPCEVYTAPFDVRLPDHAPTASDTEIITVVQPDIVVICDHAKLDDRGCLGAPDLVVEILSPHTAAKDLKVKRNVYERHGVKEYWLVHPADKLCLVYHLGEDGLYGKDEIYADEDVIASSAIAGLTISLTDIFGQPDSKTRQNGPLNRA